MIKKIEKYGAVWCNPCKVLEKTITEVDVPVTHYDADEDTEKFIDAGIKNIPVLIFKDEEDKEVARTVGAVSLKQIQDIIKKHA